MLHDGFSSTSKHDDDKTRLFALPKHVRSISRPVPPTPLFSPANPSKVAARNRRELVSCFVFCFLRHNRRMRNPELIKLFRLQGWLRWTRFDARACMNHENRSQVKCPLGSSMSRGEKIFFHEFEVELSSGFPSAPDRTWPTDSSCIILRPHRKYQPQALRRLILIHLHLHPKHFNGQHTRWLEMIFFTLHWQIIAF